jgi:hypothetical protein
MDEWDAAQVREQFLQGEASLNHRMVTRLAIRRQERAYHGALRMRTWKVTL